MGSGVNSRSSSPTRIREDHTPQITSPRPQPRTQETGTEQVSDRPQLTLVERPQVPVQNQLHEPQQPRPSFEMDELTRRLNALRGPSMPTPVQLQPQPTVQNDQDQLMLRLSRLRDFSTPTVQNDQDELLLRLSTLSPFAPSIVPTTIENNSTSRTRSTGLGNSSRLESSQEGTFDKLKRQQWFVGLQKKLETGTREDAFRELANMRCPYGAWDLETRETFAVKHFGEAAPKNAAMLKEAIQNGVLPESYAQLMMDPGLMMKGGQEFSSQQNIMSAFITFAQKQERTADPWAVREAFGKDKTLQVEVYRGMAVDPSTHQSIMEKGFLPNVSTKVPKSDVISHEQDLASRSLMDFNIPQTAELRVRASSSQQSQQDQIGDYTFSVTQNPQIALAVAKDFAKDAKELLIYKLGVSKLDVFSFGELGLQGWRGQYQLKMSQPNSDRVFTMNAADPKVESFMLMKINPSEILSTKPFESSQAMSYNCERI